MPGPMTQARQGYFNAVQAMQTGTYKGDGDIIDFTKWDRFILDNGTLRHRLFLNGLGANNRTLNETNVVGAQITPQGEKMYVRAIKIQYRAVETRSEAEMAEVFDVLNDTTMNVEIPGKGTYGQWPLDEIMGNPMSIVEVPAAAGDSNPPLSTGRFVGIFPLNLPLVIASQISLSIEIVHHVAPSANLDGDKIRIGLNGILERLS